MVVDDLMLEACKMIGSWSLSTTAGEITHQVICLAEETGEAIEVRHDRYKMLTELADVVIVANNISYLISGSTLGPAGYVLDGEPSRDARLADLSAAVGLVAKQWRQISGMRKRASTEKFDMLTLLAELRHVVSAARHVPLDGSVLPVSAKLAKILARGRGLDQSETVV